MKLTLLSLLVVLLSACTNNHNNRIPTIKIAAAASTQPVLKALQAAYKAQHEVNFENYVQASGKLVAQIEQGARIDLFLSADSSYPAYLQQHGRTATAPVVYARGSLALWSRDTTLRLSADLNAMPVPERLVVADAKAAPYGRLAQRALQEAGLDERWKKRLIYGQNIEQVNLYLYQGLADWGLTARSSLEHPKLKKMGQFVALSNYQLPQAVALIQPLDGSVVPAARAFYQFLQEEQAQTILMQYGYQVP
jgi:molybdate transport system substrate-binding protein